MTVARDETRGPFPSIAGHPALDVVNTVDWRLSPTRRSERLLDFDDVVAWVLQFALVDDQEAADLRQLSRADPSLAADELERVRELREGLYAAAYRQPEATTTRAELVTSEYAEAIGAGRLERSFTTAGEPWVWRFDVDLSLARRRLALAAVDLLAGSTPDALGQCADDECGWVFLDTSPRHNRRWCVAADCGNRNRVRRFNERARLTSLPGASS